MKYKHYIAVRDGLSEGFCYECGGGGDADYTIVKAKDAQHALDIAVSFFDADKLQYYDNPAQVHVYEMNPTSAASRTLDPPEPPEREATPYDNLTTATLKAYLPKIADSIFGVIETP